MADQPPDVTGPTGAPSAPRVAEPPNTSPGPSAAPLLGGLDHSRSDGPDWAAQMADTLEQYIGRVRDKTTRPAIVITRTLVFGIIIAILAIAAIVLLWIAWITGITALVKDVWITYLITGGIFVIVGAFLMSKRTAPGASR